MSQTAKEEQPIGHISHFFSPLNVGIIDLKDSLRVGEKIHIKGHTTDFVQAVSSMQLEHEAVEEGKPGSSIGIKVEQHVREGDEVYRAA